MGFADETLTLSGTAQSRSLLVADSKDVMLTNTLRRPRFALGVLLVWALCAASSGAQVKPNFPGTQEPVKTPEVRQKGPFTQFTSREQWQMPVRVMGEIGVRSGMTVADVGAGDGWFTFYLAERVGSSGRVIAEDIDAQALQAVRERCAQGNVSNVSVLVGEVEDPKLPAGTVDLAKGLKPDGRLVVIDWDPTKLYPEMAKQDAKSALGHTLQQLLDADFEVVKTLDFLPTQTIWICKPKEAM